MSRSLAGLLALVTLFALSIAACGDEDADQTTPAGENAAPVENGTDAAGENAGAAPENATAAGEATATPETPAEDAGNAQLAVLHEKAAELSKKIDAYTATLAGLGDIEALKSQLSTLRRAATAPMGRAVDSAKKKLAEVEAKIAQYDDVFNAREALNRELAEVDASIKELGGE